MKWISVVLTCLFSFAAQARIHSLELHQVVAEPVVTLADFRDARVQNERSATTLVEAKLRPEAAAKLERFTRAHRGEHLAIVVDGEVVSAPIVRSAIASSVEVGPLEQDLARAIVSAIDSQGPR